MVAVCLKIRKVSGCGHKIVGVKIGREINLSMEIKIYKPWCSVERIG
jgi:hypothetical protein